ncbi:phage distal tail protein, Rcc01695 family [Bosea sp. (in: a-proteobacteria)]|uniref:phage distal tail protein, Rcc01695 family n=1 Tax=Bosea sp. (in: a-proteobacteria) TaxID=1871050 RepID=UPI003B3BADF9
MSDFHEVRFPLDIARGARGGPERQTQIVTLASGREVRNSRWAHSRRRYDAGLGVRSLDALAEVVSFFEERRGRLYGFRWRDRLDCKSGPPSREPRADDQLIGTGDGVTATFQLCKSYGSGMEAYRRDIAKPVTGSVILAVDGTAQPPEAFVCEMTTGLVTFASGHVPAPGAAVSAGFAFDVPVRFDTDAIEVDLSAFEAGEIPHIPVVEILP